MLRLLMLICLSTISHYLTAQADIKDKKIKPSTPSALIWKLMDGYPKEHAEYESCKKFTAIDLKAGTVTLHGFSNRKQTNITHTIKFSPLPNQLPTTGSYEFFIDAQANQHDVGQELELSVALKFSPTNKQETLFNWVDFLGMSVAETQWAEQVNYVHKSKLNMEVYNSECLLFIIKVGTANYVTGAQSYCNTYVYKYEKVKVTNTSVADCKQIGPKPICTKTFKVEGKKPDGSLLSTNVVYRKRFYEFCEDGILKQNISDSERYSGYNYIKIGDPSIKQNCAGRVSDQLWGIGLFTLSADDFFKQIIGNFGVKISGATWGDVKEKDIVVYANNLGEAKHVAIVTRVTKNSLGLITEIQIDTKDQEQGVYLHTLPRGPSYYLSGDPLLNYGQAAIYRVNPKEIKFTPLGNNECD